MTGLNSNINQVVQQFKSQVGNAENIDFSQALIVGVNVAKGLMQFRVFNSGLDSGDKPLGKYKGRKNKKVAKKALKKKFGEAIDSFVSGAEFTPYELKRITAGRQVIYKDLEFSGDLRRGIIVVKVNNQRVICSIPNEQLFLISQGQEEDLNTVIFNLSITEREALITNTEAALIQLYDRLLNFSRTT